MEAYVEGNDRNSTTGIKGRKTLERRYYWSLPTYLILGHAMDVFRQAVVSKLLWCLDPASQYVKLQYLTLTLGTEVLLIILAYKHNPVSC
jgi:hypothetical protein